MNEMDRAEKVHEATELGAHPLADSAIESEVPMTENATASLRPEAWRKQFEAQVSPTLLNRLHRAARSQVRRFAGSGGHASHADAEDLASSVILDTLDGRLTWDPERKSLESHLIDAVRFRARNRSERAPDLHDPLEEDELDRTVLDIASAQATLIAPSLLGDDDATQPIEKCADVVEWVRDQALDKPDVVRLLDVYVAGITGRDAVMRAGRMDAATYRNARRRLVRIANRLPAELRAAALGPPDTVTADASGALKLAS